MGRFLPIGVLMRPQAGDERVEATLRWFRAGHERIYFTALDRVSQPTDVPAALGLPPSPPSPLPDGTVGLAAFHQDDHLVVLRAYEQARTEGLAAVAARLLDGQPVHVHFVDLRDDHDIVLTATLPADGSLPEPVGLSEPVPPRVTWARLDGQGNILEVDPHRDELLGPMASLIGSSPLPLLHPDDHERAIDNWLQVLTAPGEKRRYRCRHARSDGSWVWVDVTNHNRLLDPAHGDVYSEMVDVSDEMAFQEELADREQLLRVLIDALPIGVVQFDAQRRTVHSNDRFEAFVGGSGIEGLLDAVGDPERTRIVAGLLAISDGVAPQPIEVHLPDGRVGRITLRPLLDGGGVACVDDVTEAVRLRRELEYRATYDSLTTCFSRAAILGALNEASRAAPGSGVVFVDLDRFKPVNDQLGHAAGDELLAAVGARLREAVRDVDMVGRLGGDEFLIVCPGVADPADVEAIAKRVAQLLAEPLALTDDYLVRPRASIGVAWSPAGTDPAALVARADAAMYESKRRARRSTAGGFVTVR